MLAGVGTPNGSPKTAVAQPGSQFNQAPEVFFYSSAGRSYLGVDIQDVTADRLSALKLKEERGVEVTMVDQDAPAGKAGIKEHDVILEFNGTAVESEEQLRRLLRETPPGRTVTLGLSRDGNPMKISVQLGDRAKIVAESQPKIVVPKIPRVEIPPIEGPNYLYQFQAQTYSSSLGVQTENLTRQLGEFFGVKDGEGVLVRSVEKGSAAEKAGIKAGDVIVRADNEKLSDRTDLTRILRNHRDGGKLSLVIVREKHEQTVIVELQPRNSRGWWDNFDSGWGKFDSDELKGWGEEMEKWLEEIEPEIEHASDIAAMHVRSELAKAQQQVRPQIDRAMRQAQRELERSRRLVEEQQRELKNRLNNLI
jgi:membrane-associated protease RseP (regulator of RpoE activity)